MLKPSIHSRTYLYWLVSCTIFLSGCAGTKQLTVDTSRFPVPIINKADLAVGLYLDKELMQYQHKETIEKKGTWEVNIGPAQQTLFENLSTGLFRYHELVAKTSAPQLDAVLKPTITEVQFSLPSQTRSNYYEVWIRYEFQLFDPQGGLVGNWSLPAYGKANKNNFGSKSVGLQEAALSACRDAMAFFSINFSKEPTVYNWLSQGQPLMPKPQVVSKEPSASDGKEPSASDGKEPSASDGKEPSASDVKEPSASEAKEPSANKTENPPKDKEPSA